MRRIDIIIFEISFVKPMTMPNPVSSPTNQTIWKSTLYYFEFWNPLKWFQNMTNRQKKCSHGAAGIVTNAFELRGARVSSNNRIAQSTYQPRHMIRLKRSSYEKKCLRSDWYLSRWLITNLGYHLVQPATHFDSVCSVVFLLRPLPFLCSFFWIHNGCKHVREKRESRQNCWSFLSNSLFGLMV